jgi:hypothetical protein
MPKLDSLQREFNNEIQIILVTKDSKTKVDNLFSRIKTKRPNIPQVFSDTLLRKLFPHDGQPYQVWISPDGHVQQITQGYNANRKSIAAELAGNGQKLLRADLQEFTIRSSLVDYVAAHRAAKIQHSSLLVQGLSEYGAAGINILRDSITQEIATIRAVNKDALSLYLLAYEKEIFGTEFGAKNKTRLILNVKNLDPFTYPKEGSKIDDWKSRSLYCYELSVSGKKSVEVYDIMRTDLSYYFDFNARIEKHRIRCLVLKKADGDDLFKTKSTGEPDQFEGYRTDGSGFAIKNMKIGYLVNALVAANTFTNKLPIIDGTGYEGNVDIAINVNLGDIPAVRSKLFPYGLMIEEEEREIDMLVISNR